MNKKQIIGIFAAAIAFVLVCSASILLQNASTQTTPETSSIKNLFDSLESSSIELPYQPFIGVVTVEGAIIDMGETSPFSTVSYNHRGTLDLIDQYQNSEENRGILLYVNTPGGGVYESDELYLRLMRYKEETGRPVWTYMASQATSGGYYIAMASDKVIANRNTWTGSIGVIISLSNYKDLMDKIGIESILFTSGPNKSMGNPGVDITEEQAQIFQSLVDEAYEQFVSIVANGRGMQTAQVKTLADGRIYTGQQALSAGLIDAVQGYEETVDEMLSTFEDEEVELFTPQSKSLPLSSLFSLVENYTRSDTERLGELLKIKESGVPMYYASTTK